jgi:ferredoxin
MSYLAEIDEGACAAHGDCVEIAPDVFVLDDVARVVAGGPDDLLLAAAEGCPSSAIQLIDPETHEQVYP